MKIMHLMGGGDVGGAKTHIMSLVGALSRRHEVRLISFREGDFARQAGERGIDVRVIAGNRLGRSLRPIVFLLAIFSFSFIPQIPEMLRTLNLSPEWRKRI